MKQIKTIKNRLDNSENFDKEVNKALQEGWELTRREVLQPKAQSEATRAFTMLYAELEKNDITEAERCCDNCKHCDKPAMAAPCYDCEDASHWEVG